MKDTIVMSGEDYDKVVKQARADALREAAEKVRSACTIPSQQIIFDAIANDLILSLIDQPQEDVCKWKYDVSDDVWNSGCGHIQLNKHPGDDCPHCGKPIKVKE